MPFDFDPSGDLSQVADGREAVTVTRLGSSLSCSVTNAIGTRVKTSDTAADITWSLPNSELTFSVRPGDVIVDASARRWTVLELRDSILRGQTRCVCRDLAVAAGLDAHVDIEQAVYTKSDSGADVAVWTAFRTGVRARIQPSQSHVKDVHRRQTVYTEFTIFLDDHITLDTRHRIKGPDSTRYRVVAWTKADRIDALMEVQVVRFS